MQMFADERWRLMPVDDAQVQFELCEKEKSHEIHSVKRIPIDGIRISPPPVKIEPPKSFRISEALEFQRVV